MHLNKLLSVHVLSSFNLRAATVLTQKLRLFFFQLSYLLSNYFQMEIEPIWVKPPLTREREEKVTCQLSSCSIYEHWQLRSNIIKRNKICGRIDAVELIPFNAVRSPSMGALIAIIRFFFELDSHQEACCETHLDNIVRLHKHVPDAKTLSSSWQRNNTFKIYNFGQIIRQHKLCI